jgi:5-formyltetrahydrofolate cyclo-ligase
MMMSLDEKKAELRKQQAAKRGVLKSDYPNASQGLINGGVQVLVLSAAYLKNEPLMIAGYWPIRSEIDPLPMMRMLADQGIATCLPATPKPGTPLIFHQWQVGDPLVDGLYGTSEPAASAPIVIPNVILAPLLAFDQACYRLGYGGGFYDRSLAEIRAIKGKSVIAIGLAYAGQQIDTVPTGPHDAALDGVLTEAGLIERRT